MTTPQLSAAVTCLCVAALLWSERRAWRVGIWVAKPLASLGFVATAWLGGAPALPMLVGLCLCTVGDVLLIPLGTSPLFLLGIGAFALGHLAYAWAFLTFGVAFGASALGAALMALIIARTLRWLRPHLPVDMRVPVSVYMAIIALMVTLAFGASAATHDPRLALGACAFAASDLSVARERFVHASFINLLWGLPLYYAAQLTLAYASLR
ncbi:MAG: lysoplasmalogenase [Polyangiales bacterium]